MVDRRDSYEEGKEDGMIGPDAIVFGHIHAAQAVEYKTVVMGSFSSFENRMASMTSEDQSLGEDECEPNDIRMDDVSGRLVKLLAPHYSEEDLRTMEDPPMDLPWVVEDVLTGEIYTRVDTLLSFEIYNAMETLAWAAQDHPETEIAGD